MTAVVGILNKKGVAIAADSAVTVSTSSNRKIYNSANKIFTLSKYHPVGVALYSGADFMGIPWEIIIKEYREYIGHRSFDTVKEYREDFLKWMKEERNLFERERSEGAIITNLYAFLDLIIQEMEIDGLPINKENLLRASLGVKKWLESLNQSIEDLEEVEKEIDTLKDKIKIVVDKVLQISLRKSEIENICSAYHAYLLSNYFLNYTGLVFVGYGKKELFPRVLPTNISFAIGSQLRYIFDDNNSAIINNTNIAAVRPFAQKDVIQTILQGISPDVLAATQGVFYDFIESMKSLAVGVPNLSKEMKQKLDDVTEKQIEALSKPFMKELQNKILESHYKPMLDTVSHLDKEDLAEMAESLIYLTYLKRRFTMSEESVGGPVDVALITKGDGFVWIKRKHYFDPKLNEHFFQKYYK